MPTINDVSAWTGRDVVGPDGEKIGSLDHLYVDRETGEPTFVAVKTGLFGMSDSLVPVQDAVPTGDTIRVGYDKAKVKDAPNVKADGELSESEETQLYEYYGIGSYSGYEGPDHANLAGNAYDGGTVGRDTSGPETDQAMTRSEEELRVGTTRQQAGKARLRKYVVTENVTQTVPVQREEVVVEREPITNANVGAATDGPAISSEEHEVTLHEEQVITDKTVVPKERVRMDVETHTDQVQVDEEVRKERIEAEGDVRRR
ncbi:MAG: hypothetical protein JWM31_716 [Solirubrobacterales bacterium]|nr:hypothetical protein [Solirubrobacterales bacterium]